MIDGIIYTVEDIGSEVKGNKIDIYYATHEEALDHGVQEDKEAALKNGMNAHISKPLNMDIFISVLKQFVK